MKKTIWLDCDPGIDDALAILLLGAARENADLLGISVSSGNLPMHTVCSNALKLCDLCALDVPVVCGVTEPLVRQPDPAAYVHGEDGLGGWVLPETGREPMEGNGLLYWRNALLQLPEGQKCELILTAPLSNAALLLKTFPEVKSKISGIVFMGGSLREGNVTPYAEFNIHSDPEAARIILQSQIPCTMCGLDLTLAYGIPKEDLKNWRTHPGFLHQGTARMLEFYGNAPSNQKADKVPIHDALAAVYSLKPELFTCSDIRVEVDCSDSETAGQTRESEKGVPVNVLKQIDWPSFEALFEQSLSQLEHDFHLSGE